MNTTKELHWKKSGNLFLIAFISVAFLVFCFLFISSNLELAYTLKRVIGTGVCFAFLFVLPPLYFLFRKKIDDPVKLTFIMLSVGLALTARMSLLENISPDFSEFLSSWIGQLKAAPGLSGWAKTIGDYNVPYLYLLTIVAKFPTVPLFMTKLISIAADLGLAYYIMQLASLKIKNENGQIAVFVASLFVPTFIINSAYWAQCDAIYSLFVVGFIYYALSERPNLAIVFFAVAFSFKLQTIFIAPLVIVFLFARRLKLKNLVWFPVTFIGLLIPAILAGKPILDTVSIYAKQTDSYDRLSLKAPNIYQFFYEHALNETIGLVDEYCLVEFEPFMLAGIMLAGAAVLGLLYYLWLNRSNINKQIIIVSCYLFSMGIPYLLPKMHERYFYLAEVFAIAVFIFEKKRWFIPIITTYVSFRAYTPFIFEGTETLYNFKIYALIYLFVIALTVYDLYKLVEKEKAELNERLSKPVDSAKKKRA